MSEQRDSRSGLQKNSFGPSDTRVTGKPNLAKVQNRKDHKRILDYCYAGVRKCREYGPAGEREHLDLTLPTYPEPQGFNDMPVGHGSLARNKGWDECGIYPMHG